MKAGVCLLALFLVSAVAPGAWAQSKTETVKGRNVTRVVKAEVIEVGDVEGHVVGVFQRKGLILFDHGEVATESVNGTFDSTKGGGSHEGYSVMTFEDGSHWVIKWRGTHAAADGGKTGVGQGKYEYVSGTGRFAGIKGSGSYVCKRLVPGAAGGDQYCDHTMSYTLPSR